MKKTIEFDNELSRYFGSILLCPECGFDHLHQKEVEVFVREEDASTGIHATINNRASLVNIDMTENPSPRRQSVVIRFLCENCGEKHKLYIIQHKGLTFFRWER